MVSTVKRNIRKKQSVPVYLQIAEHLKEQILNKEYPCGTNLPAESELAASFGVNHLTLRKSLQILREQHLIVPQHGRGNFVSYSHEMELKIGYITYSMDGISSYYDLSILSELNKQLSVRKGYLQIIPITADRKEITDNILQSRCCALVAATMNEEILNILNCKELKHIPVCCLNVWNEHLNRNNRCFVGSKPGIIQEAVRYLTQLGHRRIAYISYNHFDAGNDCGLEERNLGFRSCGLPEGMEFIGTKNIPWHEWSRKTMHKIAEMEPGKRPTAAVLPGLAFAAGAWIGALEAGLKIPEDMSLIGVDAATVFFPELTAIKQPLDQFVEKAISIFGDAALSGGLIHSDFYKYDFEIVERGSCCSLKQ
ncbi:MAG: GntR family transcriptional regulator [Lentisphaeria bacterium]|nr:GntR family transcriptional regulator [Lentisphaeria bacterium]